MSCCKKGPGYGSPSEAIKGPVEDIIIVTCAHTEEGGKDMVACVDVNPNSHQYCQIISRIDFATSNDEIHHTGWNACSSCHTSDKAKRSHIILPCLNSSRIHIVNVEDERNIKLEKTIEGTELKKWNTSFPHTSHCLADGNIMISTLGDANGENKGNFILLDSHSFDIKGVWPSSNVSLPFNYDFWYQPRNNVMISTEWGNPNIIKQGFNPSDIGQGKYGHSVHIFNWTTHEKIQSIELPMPDGALPLEVRFKHNPDSDAAFVGTALGSSIFYIHPKGESYVADSIIKVEEKKVSGWILPSMPALITDILISMDDKYLFLSCWLHGDIRQYDITDPSNPILIGRIFIGGSIHTESGVILQDEEITPSALYIKGKRIEGGPQMLQLSLDGKRLYVTTSLYKKWDEQFYPKLIESGAAMIKINVGENGLTIDDTFLIDFGSIEGGPYLAHEMRYPGGDCTSDIWI